MTILPGEILKEFISQRLVDLFDFLNNLLPKPGEVNRRNIPNLLGVDPEIFVNQNVAKIDDGPAFSPESSLLDQDFHRFTDHFEFSDDTVPGHKIILKFFTIFESFDNKLDLQ